MIMSQQQQQQENNYTIYYRLSDGYLCDRYPLDIFSKNLAENEKGTYVCSTQDEYEETLSVDYGYTWAVIDNKLQVIPNAAFQATNEYQRYLAEGQYGTALHFLEDTDFIISKINELTIEDDTEGAAELKQKYAEQIAKRKEYRKLVNELEEKYPDLKK